MRYCVVEDATGICLRAGSEVKEAVRAWSSPAGQTLRVTGLEINLLPSGLVIVPDDEVALRAGLVWSGSSWERPPPPQPITPPRARMVAVARLASRRLLYEHMRKRWIYDLGSMLVTAGERQKIADAENQLSAAIEAIEAATADADKDAAFEAYRQLKETLLRG